MICIDLVDFGSSKALAIELARGSNVVVEIGPHLTSRICVIVAILVISGVSTLATSSMLPLAFGCLVSSRYLLMLFLGILQGLQRFGHYARTTVSEKASSLVLAVALLVLGFAESSASYLFCQAGGAVLAILGAAIATVRPTLRPWRGIAWPWRVAPALGWSNLVTDASVLDATAVNHFASAADAATYALPARVVGPLGLISIAFSAVQLPRFVAAPTDKAAWQLYVGRSLPFVGVLGTLLITLTLFADQAVVALGGSKYAASAQIFRIHCVGAIFTALSLATLAFLQARGRARSAALLLTVSSAVTLIALSIGSWLAGGEGAAVGSLAASALLAVVLVAQAASLSAKDKT